VPGGAGQSGAERGGGLQVCVEVAAGQGNRVGAGDGEKSLHRFFAGGSRTQRYGLPGQVGR
jgi:hypothetical protein